jgi:hypothetical protein
MAYHDTKSIGPYPLAKVMEHFFMAGNAPLIVDTHGVVH